MQRKTEREDHGPYNMMTFLKVPKTPRIEICIIIYAESFLMHFMPKKTAVIFISFGSKVENF